MWLANLKELKKTKGMTIKAIADKANLPERTVARIFSGETDNPYIDTLHRIVAAMDSTLNDILGDTNVVVATDDIVSVRESANVIEAERDMIAVENDILKAKVAALTSEVDLLTKELAHKEELLTLHKYYKAHIEMLITQAGL